MSYMKDADNNRLDGLHVKTRLDSAEANITKGDKFAGPSRRLAIANNCFGTGASLPGAQTTAGTSRIPHLVGADACDLQVVIGNHYTNASSNFVDTANAASIAVRAALEINSVVYPLTFSGKRDVTIDGGGFAVSDPLPITVAKGDTIYSRTYTSSTSWYANKRSHLNNGVTGGFTATTDLTGSGAGSVTNAIAWQLGPMAIIGTVSYGTPSALLIGDSLAHGYADGSDTNGFYGQAMTDLVRSGGGYLVRALSGQMGMVNLGVSSDKGRLFIDPAGHNKRMGFALNATAAVIEHGRNDVSDLQTYLTIAGYAITMARMCKRRGMKVAITTVTPRTSSTDNWFTSGNQTINTSPMETIRVAYNGWLRAGAPVDATTLAPVAIGTSGAITRGNSAHPIDVLWDVTLLAETATDSGLWKPAERVVTDAAITSGQATLSSTSAAFTNADVGKAVAVVGAGSAGAVLQTVIRSVAAGVATLNSSASTTVSGASCGIGVFTFDGTHPNQYGALLMSAGVTPADLIA